MKTTLFLLALGLLLLIFLRGSFTKQEEQKVIDISLPIVPETKEF